jgi:hypothetical protein
MKKKLSPQGRNGLAILIIAGLALLAAAVAPYVWNSTIEGELAESRSELGFLKDRLKNRKAVRKTALTPADKIDAMYFDAKTEGLSLAAFQTLVAKTADANKMRVERVQPLQSDRRASLQTLKLDIVSQGTIENMRGFILALEQAQPFIFVREAKIGIEGVDADIAAPQLTVTLRLEAYARPPATQ